MTADPWDADRPLDLEQVRRAVSDQFPDLRVERVEPLGSGWDNDSFLIDDAWVFRFPRRREVADAIERETEVVSMVAGPLGERGVRVPIVERYGQPSDDFPYQFVGYRKLPGVPADDPRLGLNESDPVANDFLAMLARHLGAALSVIHGLDVHRAEALNVPLEPYGPGPWYAEAREIAEDLLTRETASDLPDHLADPIRDCIQWLRDAPPVPADLEGPLIFIHNDVSPDHLLVDPRTGRLSGILDWGDAALGDPAFDFGVLAPWRGWRFALDVLDAYDLGVDEHFRERLRFLTRVASLVWLHDAHVRDEAHLKGGQLDKHRTWVLQAFKDTSV